MTTSAAEKLAGHTGDKKEEKPEKRRALGRGLESLLPGPRAVPKVQNSAPAIPNSAPREDAQAPGGVLRVAEIASPTQNTAAISHAESPYTRPEDFDNGRAARGLSPSDASSPAHFVAQIPVDAIDKNPYQTRYVFKEEDLIELRDSIKAHGVVQPVVVRPAEQEGRYILVLGERRLRASKMAGKDTVPALVKRLSMQQAAEMTVLENLVRQDLNPLEQAQAFRVLSTEFKLTQAQIAERTGVSRESVSNYMRLLRLPEKAMNYLLAGKLTFSDCREILALESPEQIEKLAEEIVAKHLKWEDIQMRVGQIQGFFAAPGKTKQPRGAQWQDPNVRAAQMEMERTLGMRVRIRDREGKGKITIEYASVDDYERVMELFRGKG